MKAQNLYDVITRDTQNPSVYSIYVLQCSTPYENVLRNSDPFTNSYDGKFLKINWKDKYVCFVKNKPKCLDLEQD